MGMLGRTMRRRCRMPELAINCAEPEGRVWEPAHQKETPLTPIGEDFRCQFV